MKYLEITVSSKGCPSCIATIVPHLLKIPGVKGARVIGKRVIVVLDDEADPLKVVESREVVDFYNIESWRVLGENPVGRAVYSLKTSSYTSSHSS
ncbi:MAG: heavy-metal-associated domain-containing protein [Desulfurococcaceae archaeon]